MGYGGRQLFDDLKLMKTTIPQSGLRDGGVENNLIAILLQAVVWSAVGTQARLLRIRILIHDVVGTGRYGTSH